ncbi:uncharacterized protein BDZ99DRAFT_542730 [Mytilinidion resinicola]|uniref:Xaa-Pro aminopeptidase n=1 Tax=Mytilinidion resinicola TaxID=574789 RepID=A0A6A6Z6P6_9PEZI|nr:uncharacterized protein BDZ99DRAFT_542730 [Mytilinidion resinicola]KAF2816343.1 hypothetical protein BDZ99DRAFT_542730 [Mytilinidion resinicola]
MASAAPQELKATELYNRLQNEQQVVKDFWVHIDSSSPLEKYPAKQHAQRVAQKLKASKGLIYLPGAPTEYEEDSDQPKPFRQRRYFYYLSGVNETDCHLAYDINEDTLTLFIPKIDPTTVIWNGRGSTRAEAFDKYDVDEVHFTTSVSNFVKAWPLSHEGDIYILHPDQAAIPGQEKHPRVDHEKLQLAINSARMIKDSHEIGLIRKANEITAKAHREVLLNILKFKNESQVEAIFLDACVAEGAKHQAYEVIAASGVNASTLHYIKNDEPLKGRQMMCLDAGCEWECYASDVTRSFPLSGSWPSKEAKQIYDLVQTMQNCCIKRLAPRVRYLDLHILAHQIAIGGLLALGILHNGSPEEIYRAGTSRAFFPHGLGHHIGLEVHDIGQRELMSLSEDEIFDSSNAQASSKYSPNYHLPVFNSGLCLSPTDPQSPALEEGMIVTVEPGIYFSLYALETLYLPSPVHSKYINKDVLSRYIPVGGVRIEDDILITARGYQNLTTAPKGEEMLNIIKSEAKRNAPEKDASITTTAPVGRFGKSSLETFVEPSQPSPLMQKPAPRMRGTDACRYCRTRKVGNTMILWTSNDLLEHLLISTVTMLSPSNTR